MGQGGRIIWKLPLTRNAYYSRDWGLGRFPACWRDFCQKLQRRGLISCSSGVTSPVLSLPGLDSGARGSRFRGPVRWLQRSLETVFQFSTCRGRREQCHLQPGEGVALPSASLSSPAPPHPTFTKGGPGIRQKSPRACAGFQPPAATR